MPILSSIMMEMLFRLSLLLNLKNLIKKNTYNLSMQSTLKPMKKISTKVSKKEPTKDLY